MGKMIRKNNAGTRRMACRLTEPEKSKKRRELEEPADPASLDTSDLEPKP